LDRDIPHGALSSIEQWKLAFSRSERRIPESMSISFSAAMGLIL